jgi:NfeD-like C-terminal, partner-binding
MLDRRREVSFVLLFGKDLGLLMARFKPLKGRVSRHLVSRSSSGSDDRRRSSSGLLAEVVRLIQFDHPGVVKFRGRHWRAVCRQNIALNPGNWVKVVSRRGLILIVEPNLTNKAHYRNRLRAELTRSEPNRDIETEVCVSDIAVDDLAQLAQQGKAFDFLIDEPDLYTAEDGEPVW